MCARFSGLSSSWLWLAVFLLLSLSSAAAETSSTTSEPQQQSPRPASVMVSVSDLLTLRAKIASLVQSSLTLSEQVTLLQSQLAESETIQQELSDSLTESSTALESLTQASEQRAALDKKAVDQARAESWLWMGGGVVVAGLGIVLALVLH